MSEVLPIAISVVSLIIATVAIITSLSGAAKNQTAMMGVDALVEVRDRVDQYGMGLGQFRTAEQPDSEKSKFFPGKVLTHGDINRNFYMLRSSLNKLNLVLGRSFGEDVKSLKRLADAIHSAVQKNPKGNNSEQVNSFKNALTSLDEKFVKALPKHGKLS